MTPKQQAEDIMAKKKERFIPKFLNGQLEHGGDFTTMGAFQAITNAENEIDDLDSYIWQIKRCLYQIRKLCKDSVEVDSKDILEILERIKPDGN